jgi:hypothetical protein
MSPQNRHQLNIALIVGVAVFAFVSLAHVPGLTLGIAYLAPVIFVFALPWLGRYPGERLLVALSRRSEQPRGTPAFTIPRRPLGHMPRGGGLLASALAGRAPPWAAVDPVSFRHSLRR